MTLRRFLPILLALLTAFAATAPAAHAGEPARRSDTPVTYTLTARDAVPYLFEEVAMYDRFLDEISDERKRLEAKGFYELADDAVDEYLIYAEKAEEVRKVIASIRTTTFTLYGDVRSQVTRPKLLETMRDYPKRTGKHYRLYNLDGVRYNLTDRAPQYYDGGPRKGPAVPPKHDLPFDESFGPDEDLDDAPFKPGTPKPVTPKPVTPKPTIKPPVKPFPTTVGPKNGKGGVMSNGFNIFRRK